MSDLENWDPSTVVAQVMATAVASGVNDRVREFEEREVEKETRRIGDVLAAFGVPERYRDNLRGLVETPAMRHARRWLATDRRKAWALVLGGSAGVGKSVAAAWALGQLVGDLRPVSSLQRRWWSMGELQRLGNYGQRLDDVWSAPAIVLDDFGTEFNDAKGSFASLIYGIIEHRQSNYLRTVITTNLDPKLFRQRLDERVCDRLASGSMWAGVSGPSMRRAA